MSIAPYKPNPLTTEGRLILKQQEELKILREVLNQARLVLLTSIKKPEHMADSLGSLNLACKSHWDWQTGYLTSSQEQP